MENGENLGLAKASFLHHASRATEMQEKKEARKKFFDRLGHVGICWVGLHEVSIFHDS